ncbi:MAG: DUF4333 domain-containing protein [Actinomycetota bacterium]
MARRLIVAALVLVVAGCAESAPEVLEVGSVEDALPAVVWPDDPSLVSQVRCPAPAASGVAQDLRCTAVLGADPISVDAVVDEDGRVEAVVAEPLFVVADAAAQLAVRLAADLGVEVPSVDCDRAVVVARAGTEIACVATRGDDPIGFTVRLLDADGAWTVEIA